MSLPTALPTPAHKASARTFYLENAKMNAAKSASEKERKALFAALEEAGLRSFSFTTTNEAGDKVVLAVEVKTPDTEWIDLGLLKAEVDAETFEKIVTASKKAVEEHAGKAVCAKCTRTEVGGGTRNVFVKPAK